MLRFRVLPLALGLATLATGACSGGGGTQTAAPAPAPQTAVPLVTTAPTPTAAPVATATPVPIVQPSLASSALTLPAGFTARVIASGISARELAALPNGDLLVGTNTSAVMLVPNAEAPGVAGTPTTFATMSDADAASAVLAPNGAVYVGTTNGIWKLGYATGAQAASSIVKIATVRPGPFSSVHDRDHSTTSLAANATTLYAGVGSDCDACAEPDPTRATIQQLGLDGAGMTTKATRYRNPIALTIDPRTQTLWAGGAGPDAFPYGHPYEFFDVVGAHPGVVDYGWPVCYENAVVAAGAPANACVGVTTPAVVFPAYATLIGAAFYTATNGLYAFPASYAGGAFVTAHGSYHNQPNSTLSAAPPLVWFVPFSGTTPASTPTWSDPTVQSQIFFGGFGTTASNRIGRPTGVAVGPQGSLFVADDAANVVYRIRPTASEAKSAIHRTP